MSNFLRTLLQKKLFRLERELQILDGLLLSNPIDSPLIILERSALLKEMRLIQDDLNRENK